MLLVRSTEAYYTSNIKGEKTIEILLSKGDERITDGAGRKRSEKYASDNRNAYEGVWKPIGTHERPIERLRIATPELPLTTLGAGGLVTLTYTDAKGNTTQEVTGIVKGAGAPSYPDYLTIASGLAENPDEILNPRKRGVAEALGEEALITLQTGQARVESKTCESYRPLSAIAYLYCPQFAQPEFSGLNNIIKRGIEARGKNLLPNHQIHEVRVEMRPLTPTQTLVVRDLDSGRETTTTGAYLHFDPSIGDINVIFNYNLIIPPEHLAIPTRSLSVVDGEKPHGEDRRVNRYTLDEMKDLVDNPNSQMTPHFRRAVSLFHTELDRLKESIRRNLAKSDSPLAL